MQRALNVVAFLKGDEKYVFTYDDEARADLIQSIRDWAGETDLSLSWFDAGILTDKAREQATDQPLIAQTTQDHPSRFEGIQI